MPGYLRNRFPDLSAEDRDEYTCSICREILDSPVTTTCCLQAFCEDCITEWLQTNTTCPYDRNPLTTDGLSQAPRILVNTLGRFMICCDYWDVGCREMVPLKELSQHRVDCGYKNLKCTKCQCVRIGRHDCIKTLRKIKRKAETELYSLRMVRNRESGIPNEMTICTKCKLVRTEGHDCIDDLLAINRKTMADIEALREGNDNDPNDYGSRGGPGCFSYGLH
ncbi:unnamed protein product, partial [Medioppia subpectinata]